jgi:hypothetical protein
MAMAKCSQSAMLSVVDKALKRRLSAEKGSRGLIGHNF